MPEYKKPGFGARLMNAVVVQPLVFLGISPQGAWTLTVNGRKSGKPMTAPVNPMDFEDARYLVAPRGDTHWARNLRSHGQGQLRLGRKKHQITAEEITDPATRAAVIHAYLDRWAGVTKAHFGITWPNPTEEELLRVAARTPVFRITTA